MTTLDTPDLELRQSEERYRALFDSMDEAYCVLQMLFDGDGVAVDYVFLEVNAAFIKMTGWAHAAGTRIRQLAPDHEAHWFETYGKVAMTGESIRFVQQANVLEARWFDLFAFRLGDPLERKVAVLFTDITESKRAREDLVLARAELGEIMDLAPSFMALFRGPDFIIEVANEAYIRLTGNRRLIGRPLREAFPEIEGQGFFELVESVYRSGKPWIGKSVSVMLHRASNQPPEERFVDLVYQALRATDGSVSAVFAHGVDITERKRAEDELRYADRRKTEFLAMLAHELRNPLAPIRSAVQFLRLKDGTPGVAKSMLDMMDRQLIQMVRLVDDLLDVSRISRGKIELRLEHVELSAVVRQAVEAAEPFFEASGQELIVEMPAKAIVLNADAARLSQAFGNLLSNASKFSDAGSRVRLSVENDGDHATVRVSDGGVGIHADSLLHIFDMFTQLDTSLERSRGGLGIGLTLVKDLVEMHGGTVRGMSEGLGLGSQFLVRLPILPMRHGAAHGGDAVTPAVDPLRILVVDDNADGADVLSILLQLDGHEVRVARDGQEAIDVAASAPVDVVLLDIGLPRHDGYEVARRIRRLCGHDVVLIAITGWGQTDDLRSAMEAGFDAHVTKPADIAEIASLLEQVSLGTLGGASQTSAR